MIGATAMNASVTRTVSVGVITLELNGRLGHAIPLMVGVLSSFATSELIAAESFFEMLSHFAGLEQKKHDKDHLLVKHILEQFPRFTELSYLTLNDVTLADILTLL